MRVEQIGGFRLKLPEEIRQKCQTLDISAGNA
jgi:hypothetical protein